MADTLKNDMQISNAATEKSFATVPNSATQKHTIISVSLCNINTTTAHTFDMYVSDIAGNHLSAGNPCRIYKTQTIPPKSTFIHSDKIVMEDRETLRITIDTGGSATDVHINCSYLEQT